MRTWNSAIASLALRVGLALVGSAASAQALSLAFVPASQTVGVGSTVQIDVVVAGLGDADPAELVGAFDLDVSFDPVVIAATDVLFGAGLGDAASLQVFNEWDLSTPGLVDFAAVSVLSDATLAGLQGDSVTLATLVFEALDPGATALDFVPDALFGLDVKGAANAILSFGEVGTGSVTVVPEPTTILLLGVGLLGLCLNRRRRAGAQGYR